MVRELPYILASTALLSLGTSANAATITQYVAGTIHNPSGSSTDTLGYFAPAGTDLDGHPVSIYFQYQTTDFQQYSCTVPPGSSQGSSCFDYSSKPSAGNLANLATPNSVLISIQLNGTRRSFAPFSTGGVYGFNSPGQPGELFVSSDFDRPAPEADVTLFYQSPTAFGSKLSPVNNPITTPGKPGGGQTNCFNVSLPTPGSTNRTGETFCFQVLHSSR